MHHYVNLCTSDYSLYFLAVVYSTKGLLLAFGCFLAWETKKVTIPALNDSHNIGMCIYNVVVLSVISVTLPLVLQTQITLNYILTSVLLILGTTIIQLIVFIPKASIHKFIVICILINYYRKFNIYPGMICNLY